MSNARYSYVLNPNVSRDSQRGSSQFDGVARYDVEDANASALDRVIATGVRHGHAILITRALNAAETAARLRETKLKDRVRASRDQ